MSTFGKYDITRYLHTSDTNQTAVATSPFGDETLLRLIKRERVSPGWLLTMEHESRRLQHVDNLHYNPPIDAGVEGEWAFLAYRWNVGTPLSKLVQRRDWPAQMQSRLGCQSMAEAILCLAEAVLEALRAVHAAGAVHRDVRPSHIIVADGGHIILSGFGPLCVAVAFNGQGYDAREFATFASPELAGSIDHDVTAASDLYSLGVVLFTCLTGRPPFSGNTVGDILFQHLTESLSFGRLQDDVPDILVQFIQRLLAKEVRDRYQSAESALKDAQSILAAMRDENQEQVIIGCHDQRSELTEPAFVGRADELGRIEDNVQRVKTGDHRTVAIIGRSGMGKSRLLLESVRLATRAGFNIYQSVASDQATQQPLGPVLTMVDTLAKRLAYDESLAHQIASNLVEFKPEISTAMPTLSKVLGWEGSSLSGPEELGQGRVIQAFCRVLTQCSVGEPTLLCFDDCQWLDNPSLRVLQAFAQSKPINVLLMLGMRPKEAMADRVLEALPQADKIEFGELDDAGIYAIAESMAGYLPEEAKECVAALSAGSPFLATAAMRGLVESEALVPAKDGWRIDVPRLNDFQADGDAASVLLRRFQYLGENTLELLSIGAVIGKQFDIDIPIGLLDRKPEDVFEAIETARAQGLIWTKPDGRIAFLHDRIRESALQGLDDEERRRLHQQVADYLVAEQSDRYFDIAYHFDEADLPDLAWPHALQAAEKARATYALDTAESQYRIAVRALPEGNRRRSNGLDEAACHRIEVGLADVLMLLGKYEEAEQWLKRAHRSAPTQLAEAKVGLRQGELAFKRGDKERAMTRFEEALRDSGHIVPSHTWTMFVQLVREVIVQAAHTLFPRWFVGRKENPDASQQLTWQLYSRLSHCYWYVRDKYHSFWSHLREMNLAEVYQPTEELAQAYSEHAPAMGLISWQSRGLKYARRSLAMRRETQNWWGQGQSQNFLSIMLYACARYEECLNQAQQSISVLERTGDFWEMHMAQYQAAASLYRMGQLREAAEAARSLYDSAIQCGDDQSSGNAIDLWARATLGRVPEEIVQREVAKEVHDHQGRCHIYLARGVQLHFAGRHEEAIESFEKALLSVKETGVLNAYITPNYAWLVTSLRAQFLSNPPLVHKQRVKACQHMFRCARSAVSAGRRFKNELPHALRELGAVHALFGNIRKAIKCLRKSIVVAENLGAKYEVAQSRHLLASLEFEYHGSHAYQTRFEDACEALEAFEDEVAEKTSAASLSLIDRFDVLLDAGRNVTVATNASSILERTLEASRKLLRGERAIILHQPSDSNDLEVIFSTGGDEEFDPDIVHRSMLENSAVIERIERLNRYGVMVQQSGTFLCCPIQVHEQPAYFLYVANTLLTDLFGDDELRIATFLASSASGALDRAESFEQLELLNENLEQRVADRTEVVVQRSRELERTANELRETQVQLENAKTLAEKASESKSSFLACMSHEIRTPMSAVLGFTEILRTREIGKAEQERYLQRIHSNSQHLLALLNDILDFSKSEAGKLEVEQISCNPYELVSDSLSSLAGQADDKEIALTVQVKGKIPASIQTDPTRLRQIVTNLVGNAIKFTSVGSVKVVLQHLPDSGLLQVSVIDTGIGIGSQQLAKIFEPFTQADASTTRQFGGTGLGLSISKRLSEALGGDIEIESQEGKGSIFRVTISTGDLSNVEMVDELDPHGSQEDLRTRTPRALLKGERILVVDDVEANRELIGFLLAEAGAEVEFANNGLDAIEYLQAESHVSLVLMDMQMPVLDGYQATRQLRDAQFTLPIVAMTANTMQGDQERCLDAGCSAYLSKPINFEALIETVRQMVSEAATEKDGEISASESGLDKSSANGGSAETDHCSSNSAATEEDSDPALEEALRKYGAVFLADIERRWDEFEEAVSGEDYESLAKLAHWIKGTGGTFGFTQMQKQMEELENVIRENEYGQVEQLFNAFRQEFNDQSCQDGLDNRG